MTNSDSDRLLVRVGRKIKTMRVHAHMTHAEFARKLRIGIEAAIRIEKGQYNLRLGTLLEIARIFGRRLKIVFVKKRGKV